MAGETSDRYALGRLVLDYLRIFIWPLILFAVVLLYRDDVREILRNREFEVAGVFKIGQQVERLEEQANEEIADVRVLLQQLQAQPEEAQSAELAADIENKLDRLTSNLSREVQQIQEAAPDTVPPPSPAAAPVVQGPPPDERLAAKLEGEGFRALVDRDLVKAIESFSKASDAHPGYHNVAEIRDLLLKHQDALTERAPQAWDRLYRVVLTEYSWGMPKDIRPKLRKLAAGNYR